MNPKPDYRVIHPLGESPRYVAIHPYNLKENKMPQQNTSDAVILYPELRLVAYDKDQKAQPAIAVSGNFIKVVDLKDQVITKAALDDLTNLMLANIRVRQGGAGIRLSDVHNNHPAVSIAKQLIHFCEQGKAGHKVIVSDDATDPNRKYLILQITKQG